MTVADIESKFAETAVELEAQIVLTSRESVQLLKKIENPQPRNDKFIAAQARYEQIKSSRGAVVATVDSK